MNICLQQTGPSARSGGSRHATANRVRGPDNAAPAVSGRMPPRQGVQVFSARVWLMIRSFSDRSHRARYRASRPLQGSNMRTLDDLAVGRRSRWGNACGKRLLGFCGSPMSDKARWVCLPTYLGRSNGRNWIVMRGLSSVPAPCRFLSPRANSFGTAQENRTRRQSLQEVSTGELICDC